MQGLGCIRHSKLFFLLLPKTQYSFIFRLIPFHVWQTKINNDSLDPGLEKKNRKKVSFRRQNYKTDEGKQQQEKNRGA